MFRFVKWLLGFLVTLVVLILAAIIIVPMVFDPNDYREEITKLVKEQTGRELRLDGELKVSVFPWLGIRTERLALSQPAEIGGDMVSVETAQLRVKFSPLLSKQVHIDTIVLDQPQLRLVTLKNGTDSFSGLTGDSTEPEPTVADDGAGAAVALVVQGIELTDGSLIIDDQETGSRTEVSKLNVITGNLLGDSLADLQASGSLNSSESPDSIDFNLTGQARINVETLLVNIADLQATLLQADNEISLSLAELTVADATKIDLSGLDLNLKGLAKADLSAANIKADLNTQRADIPELKFQAGPMKGRLTNLSASKFVDDPRATGHLVVEAFNAAQLLKDFEVDYQTTDPKALQKVALEADFNGSMDAAEIKNLVFTIDDSELKGSAGVRNFEQPAATFDLVLNQLNLDRYLPPSDETEEEEAVSGGDALAVPMAAFKELQANGQFKAQSLISGGVELNDIDVQVRSTPVGVTITPTASLYDGSLDGQIAFSEVDNTSTLAVKNKMDLVQLGKLLNAADVTDQLSGVGSVLVDLVVTEINGVQSNKGVIKLQAKDGAVQGVDIKGMVDGAYAQYQSLKGREPSAEQENQEGESKSSDETKFAELFGTFNVNDNVITNDDFTMKAPLFRVGGSGTIDVAKQTMDYLVEVNLVASTDGQGGESVENLAGIPIPVRLYGDLTEPSYSVDFKRMYKALFAREVDRKKGELLKDKLGIEGGEELSTKEVLKGFLGSKIDKKLNKNKPQGQERPLTERDATSDSAEKGMAPKEGDPSQESAPQKSEKEQLKDELKNKLLDGLFGK